MRKLFTVLAVAAIALSASAQRGSFEGNKFTDNWSVGIIGGAQSDIHGLRSSLGHNTVDLRDPVSHPGSFWQRTRPVVGLELSKQWTPILATSIMGTSTVNTTPSHTVFDEWGVMVAGKINLVNLFFGYTGAPRFFDVEGVAGIGLNSMRLNDELVRYTGADGRVYGRKITKKESVFQPVTRLGLNFNFNLGESKSWTISLRPAIVYNLGQETYYGFGNGVGRAGDYHSASFDINYAKAELMAGVTYHFKNSNGLHYMSNVQVRDCQAEIDAMNARINALRAQLEAKDADIARLNREIADLQKKLNDCLNRKPETKIVEKIVEKKGVDRSRLTTLVHFPINQTTIQASQVPNVERVAAYLKKNPESSVVVEGWASIDGPAANNKRLSEGRAKAVKDMLINKYGIAANRIDARSVGNGILTEYSVPEWNRVSECTIVVKD
ncbi:MAG: OmpA family protein [Bacteroidaceae bacterium]|nr:OmpA family protein [Bacteroidaceae bacterium]